MLFSTRAEVIEDRLVEDFKHCTLGAHREYLSCSQAQSRLAELTGRDEPGDSGSRETADDLFEYALAKAKALFPGHVEEWAVDTAMGTKYEKVLRTDLAEGNRVPRYDSFDSCQHNHTRSMLDAFLAGLPGLDLRIDDATGMYNAVALVRSGGACLSDFRRDRSQTARRNQQTREQLVLSVMRTQNLPREKVWLPGTGGDPSLVCSQIAYAIAVWLCPNIEAQFLTLVARTPAKLPDDGNCVTSTTVPNVDKDVALTELRAVPDMCSPLPSTSQSDQVRILTSQGVFFGVRGVGNVDGELHVHLVGGASESGKCLHEAFEKHKTESEGWCTYSIYPVANAYVSTKDVQEDIKSSLRRIPGAFAVPGTQREEVLVPLGLPSQCIDDPAFAEEIRKRVETALEVADRHFRAGTDVSSLSTLESERAQLPKQPNPTTRGSDVQLAAVRALAQIAGVVIPQTHSADSAGQNFAADQCNPDRVRTAFEAAAARP
jgi:hypothetical protein